MILNRNDSRVLNEQQFRSDLVRISTIMRNRPETGGQEQRAMLDTVFVHVARVDQFGLLKPDRTAAVGGAYNLTLSIGPVVQCDAQHADRDVAPEPSEVVVVVHWPIANRTGR